MMSNFVEIKAVTWQKDSHGLFDYETKNLAVKKYRVDSECKIFRNGFQKHYLCFQEQEIILAPNGQNFDPLQQFLTSIIQDEIQKSFFVNPTYEGLEQNTSNENFLIIRSLKNSQGVQKGYILSPGDILKLGRIQYAVIEVRDSMGVINSVENKFESTIQVLENERVQESQNPCCRICLFETISDDNPFITPCKCKGTQKYVHFQCLKQWIESRGYKKTQGNTELYRWKKLDCEVCLFGFPKKIVIENCDYALASIERPETAYIIMQSISQEKKIQKGLFLIRAQENETIKLVEVKNMIERDGAINVTSGFPTFPYLDCTL